MKATSRSPLFATCVAALAAGACFSDSPSSPAAHSTSPPTQALDVSAVISQMIPSGLGSFPGASAVAGATSTGSIDASACQYAAATGSFVCPPYAAGGVTYNLSYWLYDASGKSLSSSDAAGVAAIRAVSDFTGKHTIPAGNGQTALDTETGHSDLTMSGLLTSMHMLGGKSSVHDEIVISGNPQTRVTDVIAVTSNVVPGTAGAPYPKSGTIDINVNSVGLPSFAVRSLISFNGTSVVTLSTTIGAVTVTCQVNLATDTTTCS
jgi:hypothetical protein